MSWKFEFYGMLFHVSNLVYGTVVCTGLKPDTTYMFEFFVLVLRDRQSRWLTFLFRHFWRWKGKRLARWSFCRFASTTTYALYPETNPKNFVQPWLKVGLATTTGHWTSNKKTTTRPLWTHNISMIIISRALLHAFNYKKMIFWRTDNDSG